MKIKKGDTVKVLRGKDKGKTAQVEHALVKEEKVLVTGINMYKRHVKARTQGQKSEIVSITKPVPVANVMLVCPKCKQPTRVGYRVVDGKKARMCKKCEQTL